MASFIDDGYVEQTKIDGVWFEYRPLTYRSRVLLSERLKSANGVSRLEILREMLRQQFVNPGLVKQVTNSQVGRFLSWVTMVDGRDRIQQEREDAKNLFNGVWLIVKHPRLAATPCEICRKYWFDPLSAQFTAINEEGKPHDRSGETLCELAGRVCPAGHYASPNRLNVKNSRAYQHYLECRAAGNFPDDGIVRRNARIIERAIQSCRKISTPSSR